jgi:peptidyl-tRNA hydrolase, PTH1 family
MAPLIYAGLGNPGPRFQNTRHNLGIITLNAWVASLRREGFAINDWQLKGQVAWLKIELAGQSLILLKTLTFMNSSGPAIHRYLKRGWRFFLPSVDSSRLLILHDDIELPLGKVKFRASGSARGHNGIRSLQQSLHTLSLPRLHLGIGAPVSRAVEKYVLAPFSLEENKTLAAIQPHVFTFLQEYPFNPTQAISNLNQDQPAVPPTIPRMTDNPG